MPKLHLKVTRAFIRVLGFELESLPPTPQDEPAFSPEEIEKLPAALKLEPKDVELVLDTSTFIMQQVLQYTHNLTHCT